MELHELIAKRLNDTLATRDAQILELSEVVKSLRTDLDAARKEIAGIEIPEAPEIPTVQEIAREVLDSQYLVTVVDTVATAYLQENPPPAGKDGRDGADGRDGKDGEKGDDGKDGEDGRDGADGKDGQNGIGLAGAMIDRNGELLVTMTNGEVKSLGPVVGRDGSDGIGFDDMSASSDGEGGVLLKFTRGDLVKEFPLNFSIPVYRGYWREGRSAKAGHVITNDGQAWIALRDTSAKPCYENKEDYALMVRKGRDGETIVKTVVEGPRNPVKLGGA